MRTKPRAQERPKAFHRIDVYLTETILNIITGIPSLDMIDGFMCITPGFQRVINSIFISKNECARLNGLPDKRLNSRLLNVGEHPDHHFPAALNHAQDRWLFLLERAASRRALQPSTTSEPALLEHRLGMSLMSSHNIHLITFDFAAQLNGLFLTTMLSRSCLVMSCATSLSRSNSAAICALDRFNPMKYKHSTQTRNG